MQVNRSKLINATAVLSVSMFTNCSLLQASASPIFNLINAVPTLRVGKPVLSSPALPAAGKSIQKVNSGKLPPLECEINNIKVLNRDSLGRIGRIVGNFKKNSLVLMHTVNRKETVTGRSPNVMVYTDIACAPSISGQIPLGDLQPRTSILHLVTKDVVTDLSKLEEEITTTAVPDNLSEATKQKWNEVRRLSGQVHNDIATLVKSVAAGNNYKSNLLQVKKSVLGAYDKSEVIAQLCHQMLAEL